jgi:HPt (histidine-containing phosphotransfer) domain-containing protein
MIREAMVTRFGDQDLVEVLIGLFVAECPRMLNEVRSAIESGSADAVRSAAHSFKGCVANFDHPGAVDAARTLETIGREGRLADATQALVRLEQEVERLLQAMRTDVTRTSPCGS